LSLFEQTINQAKQQAESFGNPAVPAWTYLKRAKTFSGLNQLDPKTFFCGVYKDAIQSVNSFPVLTALFN
jgi:hypothetical protein